MNLKYSWVLAVMILGHLVSAQNFKGPIVNEIDNTALAGAHLRTETGAATYSDSYGNFEIKIPDGGTQLKISFVGYKTLEQQVTPNSERTLISLKDAPISIDGVMVTGNAKISGTDTGNQ